MGEATEVGVGIILEVAVLRCSICRPEIRYDQPRQGARSQDVRR